MMEGISHEVRSGWYLKPSKLIAFYDDNGILMMVTLKAGSPDDTANV